jgi:hypothetical protein
LILLFKVLFTSDSLYPKGYYINIKVKARSI